MGSTMRSAVPGADSAARVAAGRPGATVAQAINVPVVLRKSRRSIMLHGHKRKVECLSAGLVRVWWKRQPSLHKRTAGLLPAPCPPRQDVRHEAFDRPRIPSAPGPSVRCERSPGPACNGRLRGSDSTPAPADTTEWTWRTGADRRII